MNLRTTKIDFQAYPRYDRETLTRKVHAVIGTDRMKVDDGLSDDEWLEVFRLCEKEYRYRKLPIVSARTMHVIERLSFDLEQSRRERGKFNIVVGNIDAPRIDDGKYDE